MEGELERARAEARLATARAANPKLAVSTAAEPSKGGDSKVDGGTRPGGKKVREGYGGILGRNFDLDEGPDAPPVTEQLAAALRSNATRVIDLFREWDANGDGEVSRAEFHKAMPALGWQVPKSVIDALFTEWDSDGGGVVSYQELRKNLGGSHPSPASRTDGKKKKGADAARKS